jgi:DNA-binding HxlR family transcriptional regulator
MQVTRSRKTAKKESAKKEGSLRRSRCAVACTLDLVGDKWSLLVVRDLFRGSLTYGELQSSFEGIPTNILADRLKKLEDAAIISKSEYQQHPVRYAYALTEKGRELGQVLLAIVRWGTKHIPGTEALGSPTLNAARGRGKLN